MHLVTATVPASDSTAPVILLRATRQQLAKRIWRGTAADGVEFGFDLPAPLKHGDTIRATVGRRYVVEQQPEPVLEIPLAIAPSAAAGIGWAIGNLHLELSAEPDRLLTPDEPAVRQLLARLQVPYRPVEAIFRPGRFTRGASSVHELGTSHRH